MGERLSELVSGLAEIPRLIGINLLCFVACLPLLAWFYLAFNTYANAGSGGEMVDFLPGIGHFVVFLLHLPPLVFYGICFGSALLVGPLALGLHAVAGAVVKKEDVSFSDFLKQARRNFLRGILLGIFSVVLVHLLLWNSFFHMAGARGLMGFVFATSRWVSIGLLALLFLTLPFVCQMLVATQLSFWAALKNALILARVYLGRGLLALFCILLYWWGTVAVFPLAGLFALPLLSFSLTVLLQAGVCWPVLEKHVLGTAKEL